MNPLSTIVPSLPVHVPPPGRERDTFVRWAKAGIRYWIHFFTTPSALYDWRDFLEDASLERIILTADLERGAGHLVHGTDILPDAMAFANQPVELAEKFGFYIGQQAAALGIDIVYAPVADVNLDPRNPIINIRSFGTDPKAVAERVAAFTKGLEKHVGACLKHFPGHGNTAIDSHITLPSLPITKQEWLASESVPFQAGIAANPWGVMVGHLRFPAIDPTGMPASLSRPIVSGLLRDELKWKGTIITDALNMEGPAHTLTSGEIVVESLKAGCDLALMPMDVDLAIAAVTKAVDSGQLNAIDLTQRAIKAQRESISTEPDARAVQRFTDEVCASAITSKGNWSKIQPEMDLIVWGDKVDWQRHAALLAHLPHADSGVYFGNGTLDALTRRLNRPGPKLLAIFMRAAAWIPMLQSDVLKTLNCPIAVFGNPFPFQEYAGPIAFMYTDVPAAQFAFANWWKSL